MDNFWKRSVDQAVAAVDQAFLWFNYCSRFCISEQEAESPETWREMQLAQCDESNQPT